MLIKTAGVVVKVKKFGDEGRLLWILTTDRGLVRVFDKEQSRNINLVATELFCYSMFILLRQKGTYKVNSAEVKEVFWGLRSDVISFALASYFCELVCEILVQIDEANLLLDLMICSFHMLAKRKKNAFLVKAAFEFKVACLLGFCPDLTGVGRTFSLALGCLVDSGGRGCIKVSDDILAAMSFVSCAPVRKSFSFALSAANRRLFSRLTEGYLIEKLEGEIKTLVCFKKMIKVFGAQDEL
ncbi:MAG: DNA repair protein RecO [Oscillospiraceae bacterium]|nr:DNA repair protein RecO [Oscillospiraceae bacterium]